MTRRKTEIEATYVCPNCEEDWRVEGRWTPEGDFEPIDEDDCNCPECDSVGEYQEDIQ